MKTRIDYISSTFDYKGKKIQVYEFGKGDKLIFGFPGFSFPGIAFSYGFADIDPNSYKFLTFDLPGWGGWSENIFEDNSFDANKYVELALEIIEFYKNRDNLTLKGFLGYSFGTRLAIEANKLLDYKYKCVLVSPVILGGKYWSLDRKLLITLASRLKTKKIMKNIILKKFYKQVYPEIKGNYSDGLLDQITSMLIRSDGLIMIRSLDWLLNSSYEQIAQIKNMGNKFFIINSRDEYSGFKKQAMFMRRFLLGEKTAHLRGDHNQFLLKPKAGLYKKIIDFIYTD